ncbi:hypothetical protein RhiirA1_479794 [Rhizophagus irregularis]|uniref:Uncharacterized protein n=1 Tax=Rhizophagus irregularis TaxID=588596 RepID=A0A2I1FHT6_9GLOM|nr:hypothetical protein RhiirA1_479794 [Rhizophagus irregularis]PKY33942.1 hypothetical protein RhiirB3_453252 [Rhizophagus irregularis]
MISDIFGPSTILVEGLIKMCNKCLEFMDKKENRNFQVAYRIELLPNNNQKEWKYAIQLDPVIWFDMLYNLSGDLLNTLKAARSYVNSVRRKYKLPAPIEPTMNSILSKIYCRHHADCKYPPPPEKRPSKNHNSNHEEPPVFCAGMTPQQVRFPRYCNWYVEKERIVIEKDGKDGWICVSQQDDLSIGIYGFGCWDTSCLHIW